MRPGMEVILNGDGCWSDLADKKVHHQHFLSVAGLEGGMKSGKPSVAIRINLDDGSAVVVETSLALFLSAADAFKARFGDPRT